MESKQILYFLAYSGKDLKNEAASSHTKKKNQFQCPGQSTQEPFTFWGSHVLLTDHTSNFLPYSAKNVWYKSLKIIF